MYWRFFAASALYRDIFAKAIEGLFREGLLGAERAETSQHFFELLKQADQSCFDHVLKEVVAAINPRTRWILVSAASCRASLWAKVRVPRTWLIVFWWPRRW